jgi:hypothetical protein
MFGQSCFRISVSNEEGSSSLPKDRVFFENFMTMGGVIVYTADITLRLGYKNVSLSMFYKEIIAVVLRSTYNTKIHCVGRM